jgi:glycerophosphoryl diester phosphodiesterase
VASCRTSSGKQRALLLPANVSLDRKAYFATPLPRVFAHRGLAAASDLSDGAPENSLLAFAAAVGIGVQYIETDVHASKDGVAVISHDPDLSRLTGLADKVGDLTLEQLRAVKLGSDQYFCSLIEALDAFPKIRFNIDVKSADAVQPTVRAIREAGALDRVLITSFSEARRVAAVRALTGVATSAGAFRFAAALVFAKLGLGFLLRAVLRSVDAVQVPQKAMGLTITTRRMIRALHSAQVEVHVWTINDAATMSALLDLGVDGIVTDRADIAMRVVDARR